ncbi:hypothetical protein Tco_0890653, partial [Tanacetum coccineum]
YVWNEMLWILDKRIVVDWNHTVEEMAKLNANNSIRVGQARTLRDNLVGRYLSNTLPPNSDSEIEAESALDYFVLPIWSSYTSTVKSSKAKNACEEPNKHPDLKTDEKPVDKEDQVFLDELERLKRQEQDANDAAEALRKEFAQDTEDLLLQAGAAKASSTKMDVKSAFLYGKIDEEVYVSQPLGFVDPKPDIMFAVCACSRFQVTPKTSHLSAVKRIFRYLKGKPKLGLWYPRVSSFDLEAYSDSDYAGANLDRKSTTGGCQFLGRRLISWQCKKQTIVATSTTEAEYVAAANCCGQVLWIQNQMLDYGFNFMNTKIYIDNESTICIVKNPVFHSKTKHIAIRHHFIRDAYEKKLIQVLKIHTDDNVADLLTKAFDVSRFQFLVVTIGMINP